MGEEPNAHEGQSGGEQAAGCKARSRTGGHLRVLGMGLVTGLALLLSEPTMALDVNAATQSQLESLRGVGPKTAQLIVQERARGGRYASIDDLSERVKGIGAKKAAALQALGLRVGGGTASPEAAASAEPRGAAPSVGASRPPALRQAK